MGSGREDYRTFRLGRAATAGAVLAGVGLGLIAAMLFYRQWFIVLAGAAAGGVLTPKLWQEHLREKRQVRLAAEFKDALYDLTVGLRAGRSPEGAFLAAQEDMDPVLMPLLYSEWSRITGQIRLGIPVEESLRDFAERSGIEEIRTFAGTVEICKRSEGNMAGVMENTIRMLTDRMEMKAELRVLLARKRMEQRVMSVMPFAIIGMLLVMSPDYLAPLYSSVRGYLIMAVCAVLTVISLLLARKMVRIEL